jgi:GTP-binding protein Era
LTAHLVQEIAATLPEERAASLTNPRIWPISAKRKDSLLDVLAAIGGLLPESEWLYPSDDLTDRSQKFVCGELIREQAFRCLGAELPYHLAVRVEDISWEDTLVRIEAELIVGRMQHRAIVIGKGGQKVKEIGTKARLSLEQHFDTKVFLGLDVIVDEGWVHDKRSIIDYSELGDFQI